MTVETAPVDAQAACYRHDGRLTGVRCIRCERPICPACMREAAVGYQCPLCARPPRVSRLPRPGVLMAAGGALMVLAAAFWAVAYQMRSSAPAELPRASAAPSVRETGLPNGFRHSPPVALPPAFPALPGGVFLGYRSLSTSAGPAGDWLFVDPGGQCSGILDRYRHELDQAGDQLTTQGTGLIFTRPGSSLTGRVRCPFPPEADASTAVLSGPWVEIVVPPA